MTIFIQDRFEINRDGHSYSDAIVLPKEDYEKLSEEELSQMKEDRFTNWVNIISTPQVESPIENQVDELKKKLPKQKKH